MLAASSKVAYISEPLNVLWHRTGVMRATVEHWYTYICEGNQDDFYPAFRDTLNYRYGLWEEFVSLRSLRGFLRMIRGYSRFLGGRVCRARPLLKDPFAVFSAPWFAKRLGCQVVITVRHPAAVISSLKRLGWQFDMNDLLAQPLLMRDHLEPFRAAMEEILKDPEDVITQGSLLWRMIYQAVNRYRVTRPDFLVFRHEDLSRSPMEGFERLYVALALEFSPRVKRTIFKATRAGNPREVTTHQAHAVQLDSRANLYNWKYRLNEAEITRIRELTEDVAEYFYADEDW
jgi:hypothetical protein